MTLLPIPRSLCRGSPIGISSNSAQNPFPPQIPLISQGLLSGLAGLLALGPSPAAMSCHAVKGCGQYCEVCGKKSLNTLSESSSLPPHRDQPVLQSVGSRSEN